MTRILVQFTRVNYCEIYDAASGTRLPINHDEIRGPFPIEFWLIEFIALENLCAKFETSMPLNCACNFHDIDLSLGDGKFARKREKPRSLGLRDCHQRKLCFYVYAFTRTQLNIEVHYSPGTALPILLGQSSIPFSNGTVSILILMQFRTLCCRAHRPSNTWFNQPPLLVRFYDVTFATVHC